jgi:hypothetical protein
VVSINHRRQMREHDPRAFDILRRVWCVVVVDDDDDAETHTDSERGVRNRKRLNYFIKISEESINTEIITIFTTYFLDE